MPAASSQGLQSAAQTDSTATSPDKGPAPAQKDTYNKGHKVHRKRSGDTSADKVLHTVRVCSSVKPRDKQLIVRPVSKVCSIWHSKWHLAWCR